MYIDRYSIKADARERLHAASPRPYYEGLIYVLIAGALLTLSYRILTIKITPESIEKYSSLLLSRAYDKAIDYVGTLRPSTLDSFVSMVLQLFRSIIAAGFSLFAMKTLRREEASLWNILDGFGRFFPLLLLIILSRLLITLWSQFFLIPGILAAYRYRMAVYLMLDHPELSGFQSILLSGQLMRGKKLDLFVMDLSFLGWAMLAILPLMVGGLFYGWLPLAIGALGSAAILAWLLPYYELSCVGFYETIRTPLQQNPSDN